MRKLLLAVVLLLAPLSLFAQSYDDDRARSWAQSDPTVEINPFFGLRWGGTLLGEDTGLYEDVDIDNSEDYGINVAFPLGRTPLKLELMVNRQSSELVSGRGLFDPQGAIADIDVTYYHAGVLIPFGTSPTVTPYGIISAGVTNLDPQINGLTDENRFSASAGFGLKVPFTRNFGVRVEARGYWTAIGREDRYYDDCYYCEDYSYRNLSQGEANAGVYLKF
jgi:hypothetical protein